MKKLDPIIRKNGYSYKLVTRTKNTALYSQTIEEYIIGYEVFKILIRGERISQILGRLTLPTERFPNNEAFGYTAWTYKTLERALIKFKNL